MHYKKGDYTVPIKSDAQRKAVAKYNAKNYEQIQIRVSIGDKDKIKEYAEKHGESVNGFINRIINETIEQNNK